MTGRIRVGRRGGRVAVVMAMAAYVAGLMIAAAPPGQSFGGSCNGRLSTVGLDASHEKGPVFIVGSDKNDVIIGSKGDDTIDGGLGDDTICAGSGADDVFGGPVDAGVKPDNDTIFGERGDDTLRGGDGDDLVIGGKGNDNMVGGFGEDKLLGGAGHDILHGVEDPAEPDDLKGGDGKNLCFADAMDDPDDCKY